MMLKYQKIKGYKYRVVKTTWIKLPWLVGMNYSGPFVRILSKGDLIALAGYAWDGPSGLTFDTKSSIRGSLWHDIGYQLIRTGVLSKSLYKPLFDKLLRDVCIEDGMWTWRANLWYKAVSGFESIWGLGEDRHGEVLTA